MPTLADLRVLRPPTRGAASTLIRIGPHELLTSYDAVVAYRGPAGEFRRAAERGITTDRHLRDAGFARAAELRPDAFAERLASIRL